MVHDSWHTTHYAIYVLRTALQSMFVENCSNCWFRRCSKILSYSTRIPSSHLCIACCNKLRTCSTVNSVLPSSLVHVDSFLWRFGVGSHSLISHRFSSRSLWSSFWIVCGTGFDPHVLSTYVLPLIFIFLNVCRVGDVVVFVLFSIVVSAPDNSIGSA